MAAKVVVVSEEGVAGIGWEEGLLEGEVVGEVMGVVVMVGVVRVVAERGEEVRVEVEVQACIDSRQPRAPSRSRNLDLGTHLQKLTSS